MNKHLFIFLVCTFNLAFLFPNAEGKRIVFLAGSDSHGYGAHDFEAGANFIARCLNAAVPGVETWVFVNEWPEDPSALEQADAVIIYCDGLEAHVIKDQHRPMIDRLREKGVGFGFLHYACAVEKDGLGLDMLRWVGGFYETFWTVNPQWEAGFHALPPHALTHGVVPFDLYGEWYFNMRFRETMDGIVPILTSIPPQHARMGRDGAHTGNPHVRARPGMPEHLAWVVESDSGQRGFVLTGLHYYWNLGHPGLRKLILNACMWLAGEEVPDYGVRVEPVSIEELETLNPASPDEQWTNRARKEWQVKFDDWNRHWDKLAGPNSSETGRFSSFKKQVLETDRPESILINAISGSDDEVSRWAFELLLDGIAVEETTNWLKSHTLNLPADRQLMSLYSLSLLEVPDIERLIISLSREGSTKVQIEAVRLLGTMQRQEDLEFLMHLTVAGSSDLQEAAMAAFNLYSIDLAEPFLNEMLQCSDRQIQKKAIEIVLARGQESAVQHLLMIGGQIDNSNNSAAIRAAGRVSPVDDDSYREMLGLFIESTSSPLKKDWQMAVWELSKRQPNYPHALSIIEECRKDAPESMQRTLTGLGKKLISLQ